MCIIRSHLAQDTVAIAQLVNSDQPISWRMYQFPTNTEIHPAVEIASQFLGVIAKETTNRHVAAAMTSALFNLVMKYQPVDQSASEPPSVATALELQQVLAEHADRMNPPIETNTTTFLILGTQL